MAYTVLARKYRPQTFSDLVGQEHVTRTLGNAIASGRVAHAFLFTGVRGVGKTTTARILAKALNCTSGPTPEPCGACDACHEIASGVDLDVLEIDGASNNSVEDVRRLQETIPFRPARDRFKVVIVDEVHMLSTGAFNAFLKTLEEPPAHVKFIFATTESHKVPITIRSRCQRYDFRLIPQVVVAARVREILRREAIEADERAVAIVAREAAGSMRDALTLLDQVVAFSEGALVGEEVARALGIADRDLLHRAASAVLEGRGAEVLEVVDALAQRGLDMLHFSRALTEFLRDLVVLKIASDANDLVALVEEERARALELAGRVGELELQRAFASISLLVDEIAKASMPRLTLEMGLVRMATRPRLLAIAELVSRLEALERGAPSTPLSRGGGGGVGGGGVSGGGGGPKNAPPRAAEPAPDAARTIIEKLRGGAPNPPSPEVVSLAEPGPDPVATPKLQARTSSPAPRDSRAPDANDIAQWENIVALLMEVRPALGAVLLHAVPTRVDAEQIVLQFPPGSFYAKQADTAEARDALAEIAKKLMGRSPSVVIAEHKGEPTGATIAQLETERTRARLDATRKRALNHPIVVEALSIFEARAEGAEVHLEGE